MARANSKVYKAQTWQCVLVLFLIFVQVSTGTKREVYFEEYSLSNLDVGGEGVTVLGNKLTQSVCAFRCSSSESCAGFSCQLTQTPGASILCERCYKLSFQIMLNNAESASVMSPFIPQNIRNFRAFSQSVHQTAGFSEEYRLHLPKGLGDGAILYLQGKASGEHFFFTIMEKESTSFTLWADTDLYVDTFFNILNNTRSMQIITSDYDASTHEWSDQTSFPVGDFLTEGGDMEWVVFVTEDAYSVFLNGKLVTNYPRPKRVTLSQLKCIHLYPQFTRVQWLMT